MTSTNDGKDVKSNLTSTQKGKTYYIELYKTLELRLSEEGELAVRIVSLRDAWLHIHTLCLHSAHPTHPHLLAWLLRHTARIVLLTEWQSPKNSHHRASLTESIDRFVSEAQAAIAARNGNIHSWESDLLIRAERSKRLLQDPWGHNVLKALLNEKGEQPNDEQILKWLTVESGVIFVARLRQLALSKCDDLALSLTSAVLERARIGKKVDDEKDSLAGPQIELEPDENPFVKRLTADANFTQDVWDMLIDIELVLLHKLGNTARCIELAKQTPLRNGYHMVERLRGRLEVAPRDKKLWKNAKDVATLLAQVVITRCMVVSWCGGGCRGALYWCTRALVRLLPPPRLPGAAAALAAPAVTARHLHTLAAAVHAQCGEDMKPFVCELYIRAITAGMNELEKLKLKTDKDGDARTHSQILAAWFLQLGDQLSSQRRLRNECILTAFSVHPAPSMYEHIVNAAPTDEPKVVQDLVKKEETVSEFGSWATDSHSTKTNFVKTSESINMKHTSVQKNVLSTAILTEGECMGLSPDLCQDLAVLLSGPRVKTLSWDMKREELLANCKVYMERTGGGTRTLTTELKYLQLDPKQYQHLPEEQDNEDDIYYGIEKGYEHLLDLQEVAPEEIWHNAQNSDAENSSDHSSYSEYDIGRSKQRRHKKIYISSEDDLDPLSIVAENKKEKSAVPRNKNNKERKPRHKSKDNAQPKKSKANQKKSEPSKKCKKGTKQERSKSGLSDLIGMKVLDNLDVMYAASSDNTGKNESGRLAKDIGNGLGTYITDSDYDSQGKSSLASLTSAEDVNDVLFDGLFSMDELKSPEKEPVSAARKQIRTASLNRTHELSVTDGSVAVSVNVQAKSEMSKSKSPTNDLRQSNNSAKLCNKIDLSSPIQKDTRVMNTLNQRMTVVKPILTSHASNSKNVKESISKLLQFRRQKGHVQATSVTKELKFNQQNNVLKDKSDGIQRVEKLSSFNGLIQTKDASTNVKPNIEKRSQLGFMSPFYNSESNNKKKPQAVLMKSFYNSQKKDTMGNLQQSVTPLRTTHATLLQKQTTQQHLHLNSTNTIPIMGQSNVNKINCHKNRSVKDFLQDLQESINAGTSPHLKATPNHKQLNHSIISCSKDSYVQFPIHSQSNQNTRPNVEKKLENTLNTFARRSYEHKNKQLELNKAKQIPQELNKSISIAQKEEMLQKTIHEFKIAKINNLQAQGNLTISRVNRANPAINTLKKDPLHRPVYNNLLQPVTVHNIALLNKSGTVNNIPTTSTENSKTQNNQHPLEVEKISSSLTVNNGSNLTVNDQNDLLTLLKQQSKLKQNLSRPQKNLLQGTRNVPLSSIREVSDTVNSIGMFNLPAMVEPNISKSAGANNKIVILSNQVIVPSLNVKKTPDISDSNPSVPVSSNSTTCLNNSAAQKKSYNQAKQSSDWESVLNEILSYKTPIRGEDALKKKLMQDKMLKKEKISKRNLKAVRPQKISKQDKKEFSSHDKIDIKKNRIADNKISQGNFTKCVTGLECYNSKLSKPSEADIPEMENDLLDEIIDKDLLDEISELISEEESVNKQPAQPAHKSLGGNWANIGATVINSPVLLTKETRVQANMTHLNNKNIGLCHKHIPNEIIDGLGNPITRAGQVIANAKFNNIKDNIISYVNDNVPVPVTVPEIQKNTNVIITPPQNHNENLNPIQNDLLYLFNDDFVHKSLNCDKQEQLVNVKSEPILKTIPCEETVISNESNSQNKANTDTSFTNNCNSSTKSSKSLEVVYEGPIERIRNTNQNVIVKKIDKVNNECKISNKKGLNIKKALQQSVVTPVGLESMFNILEHRENVQQNTAEENATLNSKAIMYQPEAKQSELLPKIVNTDKDSSTTKAHAIVSKKAKVRMKKSTNKISNEKSIENSISPVIKPKLPKSRAKIENKRSVLEINENVLDVESKVQGNVEEGVKFIDIEEELSVTKINKLDTQYKDIEKNPNVIITEPHESDRVSNTEFNDRPEENKEPTAATTLPAYKGSLPDSSTKLEVSDAIQKEINIDAFTNEVKSEIKNEKPLMELSNTNSHKTEIIHDLSDSNNICENVLPDLDLEVDASDNGNITQQDTSDLHIITPSIICAKESVKINELLDTSQKRSPLNVNTKETIPISSNKEDIVFLNKNDETVLDKAKEPALYSKESHAEEKIVTNNKVLKNRITITTEEGKKIRGIIARDSEGRILEIKYHNGVSKQDALLVDPKFTAFIVDQIELANQSNQPTHLVLPSVSIIAQNKNMKSMLSRKLDNVDIVNLVSDDEDSNQRKFSTEFGMFDVAALPADLHKKHQLRLLQNCKVILESIPALDKANTTSFDTSLEQAKDSSLSINDLAKEKERSEIIEIDDSSNDSFQLLSTLPTENHIEDEALRELRSKVLSDFLSPTEASTLHDNASSITPKVHHELLECVIYLTPCDSLAEKYASLKKCSITLIRCDRIAKFYAAKAEDDLSGEYSSVIDVFEMLVKLGTCSTPPVIHKDYFEANFPSVELNEDRFYYFTCIADWCQPKLDYFYLERQSNANCQRNNIVFDNVQELKEQIKFNIDKVETKLPTLLQLAIKEIESVNLSSSAFIAEPKIANSAADVRKIVRKRKTFVNSIPKSSRVEPLPCEYYSRKRKLDYMKSLNCNEKKILKCDLSEKILHCDSNSYCKIETNVTTRNFNTDIATLQYNEKEDNARAENRCKSEETECILTGILTDSKDSNNCDSSSDDIIESLHSRVKTPDVIDTRQHEGENTSISEALQMIKNIEEPLLLKKDELIDLSETDFKGITRNNNLKCQHCSLSLNNANMSDHDDMCVKTLVKNIDQKECNVTLEIICEDLVSNLSDALLSNSENPDCNYENKCDFIANRYEKAHLFDESVLKERNYATKPDDPYDHLKIFCSTFLKTYSKKQLKRKLPMNSLKTTNKKYRKGKNIDVYKQTMTSIGATSFNSEFKRLTTYYNLIKSSLKRSFITSNFDIDDLATNRPKSYSKDFPSESCAIEYALFRDSDIVRDDQDHCYDLKNEFYDELYEIKNIDETSASQSLNSVENNLDMGFGEWSGRVNQNYLKNIISEIPAATLSDVKHNQPLASSDNGKNQSLSYLQGSNAAKQRQSFAVLSATVRDFFRNYTTFNYHSDITPAIKPNKYSYAFNVLNKVPGMNSTDLMVPYFSKQAVHVVQVGQLPVSATAQNPVSCDSRVSQATDSSPSQCSIENSPQSAMNDNIQPSIASTNEYTELTNVEIKIPLRSQDMPEKNEVNKRQHNSHNDYDNGAQRMQAIKEEIPAMEVEIKEEKDDILNNTDNCDEVGMMEPKLEPSNDSVSDNDKRSLIVTSEAPAPVVLNLSKQTNVVDRQKHSEVKQENEPVEKNDQIANAMNAAGIATTNNRAHALVNVIAQKVLRSTTASSTHVPQSPYHKTTSINALSLQQALAQILPQSVSQNSNENQSTSNVTPQVLHIVQNKNANGNQLTLVDGNQQSVITSPNQTQVLHIVQNKNSNNNSTSNGTSSSPSNSFGGLSLVDAGLQQGGNQLLHIVNTGSNQKGGNSGQLLKRVNLLTNLTNVQGGTDQKMVQFVCKSADGKSIQLNAPHQRSMVLRLQPIETTIQSKPEDLSPTNHVNHPVHTKDTVAVQQEIKSRSVYEENYAKFIQSSSGKHSPSEKSTSLPKFNQAFGKPVFQDGPNSQKNNEMANNTTLPSVSNADNSECNSENSLNLEHLSQMSSSPLLIRKPTTQATQAQTNIVQQLKQTIAPVNIQTMHGGVIYTRQIPVNIGGGQTINLITVPSTDLGDETASKPQSEVKFVSQGDIEPSIIKIVPQTSSSESHSDDSNQHSSSNNDNHQTPQPVLTQMRIKLPMLSKAPQGVPGTRVVRPSFFQIQRNIVGGANQPVYQQLVLTAAPPMGQQTIRLPTPQARQVKVPNTDQESQLSTSTLEQLREFDMVLEQVKERSTTTQPGTSNCPPTSNGFPQIHTSPSDVTDSPSTSNSAPIENPPQVLYSISNNQALNLAYVNRKTATPTPVASYVRSPDSTDVADSPTSSQAPRNVQVSPQPKPKMPTKFKSRSSRISASLPSALKMATVPAKTSAQKPLEDEQTTQRILYILAEYKEQVENSPDKDKPAPRRRTNPPSNPGSSKRKKSSSSGSRRSGRDSSPLDDLNRTLGSEDSSCGTSQGDCTENCMETHSPQDSPRKVPRRLTFDGDNTSAATQPRPVPQRNVIVADGQAITVARSTGGKPTAVLMPANYILPVSMVKGGQQIAIVTNRGPKILTVGQSDGGATNALLLQRLIGPAGLKPVLTRPGVRTVRLPTAALHNLQTFNLASAAPVASETAPPTPGLVDSRSPASPWVDRSGVEVKREDCSPECPEPWRMHSTDSRDFYEDTQRPDNVDRTVLVVQRKDHSSISHTSGGLHRVAHISSAALRHRYAMLEQELRLQKSLSEECEDLGVDSPSASELFPEAELLFASSPAAHEHVHENAHPHTNQSTIMSNSILQPDLEDQIATDHILPEAKHLLEVAEEKSITLEDGRQIDLGLCEGVVTVGPGGVHTLAVDHEEFARAHPNTTFHSEPTDEGEIQPFSLSSLKGRHITSTIFHSHTPTVLMAAPSAPMQKYHDIMMPTCAQDMVNMSVIKDEVARFDAIEREHPPAIVNNATQVIRRVCYEDDRRERYLLDDECVIGNDPKMAAVERDAPDNDLFWESNSVSDTRRTLSTSSESDKCCKSPSTSSSDSNTGHPVAMRLHSVIKEARGRERDRSESSLEEHPPVRTYPPARTYPECGGKSRAGALSPTATEVRRRTSVRGVVKRGCHCCTNGSPVPQRNKKPRQRKPTVDFN